MRTQRLLWYCLVSFTTTTACTGLAQRFGTPPPTNAPAQFSPEVEQVARLVRAGTAEDVIIAYVQTVPEAFALDADDILNLEKLGITPKVLTAMLDHDRSLESSKAPEPSVGESTNTTSTLSEPEVSPPTATPGTGTFGGLLVLPAPEPAPQQPRLKRRWTSSIIVEHAPPPPQLELVPRSPGPDSHWVPGHWTWRGGKWAWEGGQWIPRPRPGVTWVDGRWVRHGRGWLWVPGRWR